ncbi:MAG: DUF3307 domain-containing protein [Ignavibacteriaceae bacterium]|jgi:hypothetical protein|nr:DUF3307 domain-containing protein [Ignavibacteriaceae bacterium]
MNISLTQILLPLLAAHFLGDFIFQTDKDVQNKKKYLVFAKHIFVVTILSYLLVGIWNSYEIPLVILISHLIIDLIKKSSRNDTLVLFTLDQLAHYLVIVLLSFYMMNKIENTHLSLYWNDLFGNDYLKLLTIIISSIMITKFSSIIITYIIRPFQMKIFKVENDNQQGIKTGRIIGYLERIIILILFLAELPTIVGFLITAKSILRYGEIKNNEDKMVVEYVLIGTLLSFSIGIAISYLTVETLKILS